MAGSLGSIMKCRTRTAGAAADAVAAWPARMHRAAAVRADVERLAGQVDGGAPASSARRRFVGWWRGEQVAAQRQLGGAMAVGEEADMADAVEAVGQGVQQEAADELVGVERHDLASCRHGDSPSSGS